MEFGWSCTWLFAISGPKTSAIVSTITISTFPLWAGIVPLFCKMTTKNQSSCRPHNEWASAVSLTFRYQAPRIKRSQTSRLDYLQLLRVWEKYQSVLPPAQWVRIDRFADFSVSSFSNLAFSNKSSWLSVTSPGRRTHCPVRWVVPLAFRIKPLESSILKQVVLAVCNYFRSKNPLSCKVSRSARSPISSSSDLESSIKSS